jgi:hypothetical protein
MAMVRAGLSQSIIIAKIRSSRRNFDSSSQALIRLKGAGVPEAVIEAMLLPADAPSSASRAAPGGAPAGASGQAAPEPSNPLAARSAQTKAGSPGPLIFHVSEGTRVPLKARPGHLEMSQGVFSARIELVIGGRSAAYRIRDRQPVSIPTMASRRGSISPASGSAERTTAI